MTHTEFRYRIEQDTDPGDPRKEFDNVGKMICFHSRYNLGDEHNYSSPDEFKQSLASQLDATVADRVEYWNNAGWNRLKGTLDERLNQLDKIINKIYEKALESVVILPLYLYDHSGITMSTSRFSCPWDSGQVGYIYATREKVLYEWGGKSKRLTKAIREKAEKYLEGEVKTYDQYLTGDVYGYVIEEWEIDEDGGETCIDDHKDSCWGFYGDGYCREEAQALADWYSEDRIKEDAEDAVAKAIDTERRTFPVASMGV